MRFGTFPSQCIDFQLFWLWGGSGGGGWVWFLIEGNCKCPFDKIGGTRSCIFRREWFTAEGFEELSLTNAWGCVGGQGLVVGERGREKSLAEMFGDEHDMMGEVGEVVLLYQYCIGVSIHCRIIVIKLNIFAINEAPMMMSSQEREKHTRIALKKKADYGLCCCCCCCCSWICLFTNSI